MNIFVAKLDFSITSEQLQTAFEAYGQVDSAKVIMDKFTGNSKGFGFVEMPNEDEANDAINALNGSEMAGRNIVVKKGTPPEERPRRGDGGGGFRGDRRGAGGGSGGRQGGGSGYGGSRDGGGYSGGGFGGGRNNDEYGGGGGYGGGRDNDESSGGRDHDDDGGGRERDFGGGRRERGQNRGRGRDDRSSERRGRKDHYDDDDY